MIATLLERLRSKAIEKHDSKRISYEDLAHQAAREFSDASGDDIEQIVAQYLDHLDRLGLGKPEDVAKFETDVKRIAKRMELAGIHSTESEAFARQEGIAQTIKQVEVEYAKEINATRLKYDTELVKLRAELTQAVTDRRKADDAGNSLRQTAGQLAVDQLQKAHADLRAAQQQIAKVRTHNWAAVTQIKDRLYHLRRGFKYYLAEPNTWNVTDPAICKSMRENHYRQREEQRQVIARLEADLKAFEQAQPSPELYQAVKDAEARVAESEAALLLP